MQGPSTAPTSFCKCTCFTNSTIIPLDAPSSGNRPYTDPGNNLLFSRYPEDQDDDDTQEPVETPGDKDEGGEKDGSEGGRKEYRAGNCNDCNRQFCLDYNLPICRGAGMDDVFTTCFRKWTVWSVFAAEMMLRQFMADDLIAERDSRKDEAVVFIFIVATVGLLGWAAVRPWVAKWYEVSFTRNDRNLRL